MDLYTANINNFCIDDLLPLISSEQAGKCMRFRAENDKKRSLLAHALLNRAVSDKYPETALPVEVAADEYGKPHLYIEEFRGNTGEDGKGAAEFHFSLSHSGDHSVCAVGGALIGTDIEYIEDKYEKNNRLASRFFCEDEMGYIKDNESFYRIWTLKESFVKAVGLGLSIPLDSFCVFDPDGHGQKYKYRINTGVETPSVLTSFLNRDSGLLPFTGTVVPFSDDYVLALSYQGPDSDITLHDISDRVNLGPSYSH